MSTNKRITVVNDHPEFLALMADLLEEEGFEVVTLAKHQGAFEQIKATLPDLLVCDLMFDNAPAGWALLDMLYLDPDTRSIPTLVCSAATRLVQEIAPSLEAKGIRWLEKPFELERLLAVIQEILAKSTPREPKARSSTTK